MTSPAALAAGLEAQDWRETASITGDWRRFGKFGRGEVGALYVIEHDCSAIVHEESSSAKWAHLRRGELWCGPLYKQTPVFLVVGPILEQVLKAGALDTQALLIELLDRVDDDGGNDEDGDGEEHTGQTHGTPKSSPEG